MKRYNTLILIMILAISGFAQIYPDKYFIEFTDKNDSPFSVNEPEEFLSQRAIDRRERYNIPITELDFPVNPAYLQAVADVGVEIINPSKWFNGVSIFTTDPAKLEEIETLPFVRTIRKNILLPGNKPFPKVNDPISLNKSWEKSEEFSTESNIFKSGQEAKSLDYGDGFNQINMLNGIILHDQGFMGQGMVIAVLDGGFTNVDQISAFDSLYMNDQILSVWDFVTNTSNAYQGSGHGTAVLSTMGANLPGELVGTAPKASYHLLRTEDTGSEYLIEEYNWASGAEYADSVGADIINSSLSYKDFDDPSTSHTYDDMDGNTAPVTIAADYAASRGMVVVNSAGNSGNSSSWPWVGAPADGDSVFTIGSVTAQGEYSNFSSRGPTADGRLKPNFCAQGSSAAVASTNGSIGTSSGTSFSSPISAGMTACLWQYNPAMTNMEILNAIQQSGSIAAAPNDTLGYGIPDFELASLILSKNDHELAENDIEIFPNPFSDKLKVVYNSPDTHSIAMEIYDISGKLYYTQSGVSNHAGLNYFQIKGLDKLKRGVYFLRITSAGEISTRKIIKFK